MRINAKTPEIEKKDVDKGCGEVINYTSAREERAPSGARSAQRGGP